MLLWEKFSDVFYCLKKFEILPCKSLPVQKEFIRKKDLPVMTKVTNTSILLVISLLFSLLLGSCSTTWKASRKEEVPILTQDELIRPYIKLGRIQITREVYVADYAVTPDITAWGLAAVRQEAEKMGADAIILHEVTGRTTTYNIFPSTEYRATGFAIKFK